MSLRAAALALLAGLAAPAALASGPPDLAAGACAGYGPGFAPVPGTRTCLKVGGRVRSEAGIGGGRAGRVEHRARFGTAARLRAEAVTPTELGPFRAVIEVGAGNLRRR